MLTVRGRCLNVPRNLLADGKKAAGAEVEPGDSPRVKVMANWWWGVRSDGEGRGLIADSAFSVACRHALKLGRPLKTANSALYTTAQRDCANQGRGTSRTRCRWLTGV